MNEVPDKDGRLAREVQVSLREDGILVIDYTNRQLLDVEAMKEALRQHHARGYGRVPTLIKGGHIQAVDYEAMRFAGSPEVMEVCSASAIVVRTFLQRHMARMFMWYHRHPYPTRVFEQEHEALAWLRGFVGREPG